MADRISQHDVSPVTLCTALAKLTVFLLIVLIPWEKWLSTRPNLSQINQGLSWSHPFGLDNLGRDLLARIATALRTVVLPLWGGVVIGAASGSILGWLANLCPMQRLGILLDLCMSVICALPVGIVAFSWAAYREQTGLFTVIVSLVPLTGALFYLRIRDLMRRDENLSYWQAHIATGGSLADRLWRYGIGDAWRDSLLQLLGFLLRVAVAVEAALSYLGFGVAEPQASLGNILAAHFERYLRGDWRVLAIVAAALGLAATVPNALQTLANWFFAIKKNNESHSYRPIASLNTAVKGYQA